MSRSASLLLGTDHVPENTARIPRCVGLRRNSTGIVSSAKSLKLLARLPSSQCATGNGLPRWFGSLLRLRLELSRSRQVRPQPLRCTCLSVAILPVTSSGSADTGSVRSTTEKSPRRKHEGGTIIVQNGWVTTSNSTDQYRLRNGLTPTLFTADSATSSVQTLKRSLFAIENRYSIRSQREPRIGSCNVTFSARAAASQIPITMALRALPLVTLGKITVQCSQELRASHMSP